MKGFIRAASAAGVFAAGLFAASGCQRYNKFVDPCYPERYVHASRQSVRNALAPQVNNGRVLDQTVWNHHFEAGTDRLTAGGREHLSYLARRRPAPESTVYVQATQDLPYDHQEAPADNAERRRRLDDRRAEAVQHYLAAVTASRPAYFQVVIHDPPEVGMSGVQMNNAVNQWNGNAQGTFVFPAIGGAGAGAGGGVGQAGAGAGAGGGGAPPAGGP